MLVASGLLNTKKKNTISSNEEEKTTIFYDSKMNIGTVTLVFVL